MNVSFKQYKVLLLKRKFAENLDFELAIQLRDTVNNMKKEAQYVFKNETK